MVLENKYKILSALQQLDIYGSKKASKQDIENVLGINPRNTSRYLNALEEEKLITSWIEQEGRVRMRWIRLTKAGVKFELKEQAELIEGTLTAEELAIATLGAEPKAEKDTRKERIKQKEKELEKLRMIPERDLPNVREQIREKVAEITKIEHETKPAEAEPAEVIISTKPTIIIQRTRTPIGIISEVLHHLNNDSKKAVLSSETKKLQKVLTDTDKNYSWILSNLKSFLEYAIEKKIIT